MTNFSRDGRLRDKISDDLHSVVGIALKGRDRVHGVIGLASVTSDRPFTEEDISVLNSNRKLTSASGPRKEEALGKLFFHYLIDLTFFNCLTKEIISDR